MKRILIFPSCIPEALHYYQKASERGDEVLAASSVVGDETAKNYNNWILFPTIYEADFIEVFIDTIKKNNIDTIFCFHTSIYIFIDTLIKKLNLSLKIDGSSPAYEQKKRINYLVMQSALWANVIDTIRPGSDLALSKHDLCTLIKNTESIYGESNSIKLAALTAVSVDLPAGDIVEIGSLCGKTAFLLTFLAKRFAIGGVVCIDPWSQADSLQEESGSLVRLLSSEWDWNLVFQDFCINMLPIGCNSMAYIRSTSNQALEIYEDNRNLFTAEFGHISTAGSISLLHIDGNHDFMAVNNDCIGWGSKVIPGGWIIVDDYVWAHGNGPRRAGDALLERQKNRIQRAFVVGKALFIQMR